MSTVYLTATERRSQFAHAFALFCYGLRLDVFLLYREVFIPRFRTFREKIEERRGKKGPLSRIPFVVGCATLYACLASPLFVTSQVTSASWAFKVSVVATWVGFIMAAFGDLQKSILKRMNGEDFLVTNGIFSFLRHPNYTGEILGWTSSFLAGVNVAFGGWKKSYAFPLTASVFGWVGIVFVLAMAATGLEKKQKEIYGDKPEYQSWIKYSWAGPTLP